MVVCTGCSLLCEDIEATPKSSGFSRIKNLCRKGHGHFQSAFLERMAPKSEGQAVSLDQAIDKAADILREARRPLLYGWSNCALEAQRIGIDLAKKLDAVIDDTSSFCLGRLMENVLSSKLPTSTLDDVRNFADTSIFWGLDPSNSHPRLLSRFAYYPRGDKRQKSYEEERTCIVVDIRKSATTKLCSNYFKVPLGGDAEFIASVMAVLEGKIPKFGDKKLMIELGTILRKTEFGVLFPGLGLLSSLQDKMNLLENLVIKLNELSSFRVIPTVERFNTRGFNKLLLDDTGYINQVSFQDGKAVHGPENSVVNAAKKCDAALIIGSDPLSSMPFGIAKSLAKIPIVAIDPHRSLTTDAAKVVIPSAMYGLEAGGSAIRMDGAKIGFDPILTTSTLSDEQILARIKEAV